MAYTASDVGPVMVDGVQVERPLAEREATATRWNAKADAAEAKRAATARNEARILELKALIDDDTATLPEMREYLSLTT